MPTNKKILTKGILYLSITLPLLFIGPTVINSAFKNQNHPYYLPVLIVGITICLLAMFLLFLGVKTMVKSMFE